MSMKSVREVILEKYGNSKKDIVLHGADLISQQGYTLIPNYVLYTDAIGPYAKLVYGMLLSYAWKNKNSSFPGQERLAKDCGISRRSVVTALQELERKDFIIIQRRGQGKTNLYILLFTKG